MQWMKVNNEEKEILSLFDKIYEKAFQKMRTISTTVHLMFGLKVLIINKSRDKHQKYK